MIALVCILLPLLAAAGLSFVPASAWASFGCALLVLVLVCSLPWTADSFGGWLLPDPLAVQIASLTAFAWVMASAQSLTLSALFGRSAGTPGRADHAGLLAALVGLMNLASFSNGAGLAAIAAGAAGLVAVLAQRQETPAPMLAVAATGMGLALFGTVVLYAGAVPALGRGWPALSWSVLPTAGGKSNIMAIDAGFVLLLLGTGISCCLVPVSAAIRGAALPAGLAMLLGPLGGIWLATALRLRGVLGGNVRAMAPGPVLLGLGLAGLVLALICLGRRPAILSPLLIALLAAVLVAFGAGAPAATGSGLLHLTLGCLALTAAANGSRLGLASLAGLPPLGIFGSGLTLLTAAALRAGWVAGLLGLGLFGVAALALRGLPAEPAGNRLAWVGIGLALIGAWAMPSALTNLIETIAVTMQ
ncbi:hypothetical protein [Acidisphaera sp. L21]|uniref:hypothetical protein n=1 Tax=Acidisphaera sp. L21 TaxID=1641851 RepID=UPI00131E1B55|nr:hypothetical protein [Acidisphaera sp. L21]